MGARGGRKPKQRYAVRQPDRLREPEMLPAVPPHSGRRARRLPGAYEVEGADGEFRRVRFLQGTRKWWYEHARSPVTAKFLETDWLRLELTARLVDKYLRSPSHTVMAEIRLCEASIGATVGDRERLGLKVMPSADGDTGQSARARGVAADDRVAVLARYRAAASDGDGAA